MRHAGIDIGSRTIKLVVLEDGTLSHQHKVANSFNPLQTCDALLAGVAYDRITATGYGRHLFQGHHPAAAVITELKAFALGAAHLDGSCRTVLDIGGQDTKAIALDERGGIRKFEMNDKCAAGTGRFLEIMATALGYSYEEFAAAAQTAARAEPISNMCTVFAESEVISLVTRGVPRQEIALGIHRAIATRAVSLLRRVPLHGRLLFAGGVAHNPCMRALLTAELGLELLLAPDPQLVGALGCALASRALSPAT